MGRNIIETVLGAVVLVVAAFFLAFALKTADANKIQGYIVTANFPRADGLKNGSDVMVNGVKVGNVLGQELLTAPGKDQFLVKVSMTIDPKVQLPTDTVALIANESLLGGRYLSLEIGVDEDNIRTDGTGHIYHTQPPLRLDDLIGKLMFSPKSDGKKDAPAPEPTPKKSETDDYSFGAPVKPLAPATNAEISKPAPVLAPVNVEPPPRVEETKPAEPAKVDVVPNPATVQSNSDPISKVEPPVKKPHIDTRTWYDLQKSGAATLEDAAKDAAGKMIPKPMPLPEHP
jgi:phospholipid/cholesterol/gamma-HCH transport system substrate-binding protein